MGGGRRSRPRLKSGLDSPENPCLQAVAPLLKYLDEKLALLNNSLVKENLSRYQLGSGVGGVAPSPRESPRWHSSRVLEAIWELLLQAILQALGANRDVSADFYGRFHFTLEVGSQGTPRSVSPKSSPCCPHRTLNLCPGIPLPAILYRPNTCFPQLSGLRCWHFPGLLGMSEAPQI